MNFLRRHNSVSVVFLPKMHNLVPVMRKDETNPNLRGRGWALCPASAGTVRHMEADTWTKGGTTSKCSTGVLATSQNRATVETPGKLKSLLLGHVGLHGCVRC